MGIFSHIDILLSRLTEDETEKWLRFHDELDRRYQHERNKSNQFTGMADDIFGKYEKKNNYKIGGLQETVKIIDPTPFLMKDLDETEKLLYSNYIPKINSIEVTRKEKVFHLIRKGKISCDRAKELLRQIYKTEELNIMENPRQMLARDLLKQDVLTPDQFRVLFEGDLSKDKQKTNIYNNQFILQSNPSTHNSNYQCVVCGSFNVETAYNDWVVSKKIITCLDCNNEYSKERKQNGKD